MMVQYKTIGNISAELLLQLHQIGQTFFTIEQASHHLGARNIASTRRLLADMVRRGLLMRLMNGLYHIIPYENDPNNYFPNWHVATHYLAGTTPYYVGYYSAMVLHDLTTQPSFTEQIVVSKSVQPAQQVAKGISFQFICHNPQHFFGFTQQSENFSLNCYSLEEVIIEKLVALIGRTQPRDVYDLWYLLEEEPVELEFLKPAFEQKAKHKGHQPSTFIATWNRKTKLFQTQWKQYLAHQIAELPNIESVWRALNRHFKILS